MRESEYCWSSYQSRVGETQGNILDHDPCYLGLADDAEVRTERYREYIEKGEQESDLKLIREALQRGQLTGSQKFVGKIEKNWASGLSRGKEENHRECGR